MGPLPDNAIFVTLNVSSLNTNIPHNEGIEACRHFLNTRQDKTLPTERICDLIRMILAMNNFPLTISISCNSRNCNGKSYGTLLRKSTTPPSSP